MIIVASTFALPAACHPERSEGSLLVVSERSLASLGMTEGRLSTPLRMKVGCIYQQQPCMHRLASPRERSRGMAFDIGMPAFYRDPREEVFFPLRRLMRFMRLMRNRLRCRWHQAPRRFLMSPDFFETAL